MSEEHRRRVIRQKVAGFQTPLRQRIAGALSTGFPQLDEALGAGFPRGKIIELFGASSSGKTTLALQIAAEAQQRGHTVAWIDSEHAFDPAYAAELGISLEQLPLARPDSAEQATGIARELALSGAVDLVVIDSAAALVPQMELDTALGESGPGLQARVLGTELRKLAAAAEKSGAVVLFLNQLRSRGDESDSTAGGPSLKLYAAIRIALEAAPNGRQTAFRILKSKLAQPFVKGVLRRAASVGFLKTP